MVYIVEEWDSCDNDYTVFESLTDACKYVRDYYRNHFLEWYSGLSSDAVLKEIKDDLENLACELPYIEDKMYVWKADFHKKEN